MNYDDLEEEESDVEIEIDLQPPPPAQPTIPQTWTRPLTFKDHRAAIAAQTIALDKLEISKPSKPVRRSVNKPSKPVCRSVSKPSKPVFTIASILFKPVCKSVSQPSKPVNRSVSRPSKPVCGFVVNHFNRYVDMLVNN